MCCLRHQYPQRLRRRRQIRPDEAKSLNADREVGGEDCPPAIAPVAFRFLTTAGIAFCIFLLASSLSAQILTSKLTNGTTGKPAIGDDVVLITLGQGMEETAHTRADAGGHFSFRLPDSGPHLIRATHQGVTYHRMIPPGTNSVEVRVFDVSPSVADVSVAADVIRFQAEGSELHGTRLFSLINASNPPRTQMHGKGFEFFLPDGAQIDQGMAMTAGGEPIKLPPVAGTEKNQYGFVFPVRPGETQFQVAFHMKYSGQVDIDPKELYGTQHFVVMVPKTMQFTAIPGVTFQSMADPRQSDALVRVVSNTQAGQPLSFRISGTGTLSEPGDDSQGSPHPIEDQNAAAPTPVSSDLDSGKALNMTAGVSSSLKRYRWYLLSLVALLLAAGAIYRKTRPPATTDLLPNRAWSAGSDAATASSRSTALLEELKNELFKLEVDHKQKRISHSEYERARAALDHTLKRTIKRFPQH